MNAEALHADGWREHRAAGFIGHVGPLWTRREGERWTYAIRADERHLNPAGIVHGGLLTTLIDHALSTVAWESAGRTPCLTIALDTHFVAPARAGMLLVARSHFLSKTGSTLFLQGTITENERVLLTASAVLRTVAQPAG